MERYLRIRNNLLLVLLQILVKEAQDAGKQVFAGGEAGDAVLLAGIDLHIEIHAGVYKGVDVGGGVAEEYVVIIKAVDNEQLAVQTVYAVYGRCIMVAVSVLLGLLHEALGVDGIIVAPVCYRGYGNAATEYGSAFTH